MAFTDELNARFGTQNIIRWSNPDSKTATTVNATIIAAALVDVAGDFRTYGGVVYDDTDNRMIGIACDLAIFHMRKRFADAGNFASLKEGAIQALKDLRKVTHSDTITAEKTLVNEISLSQTDKSSFSQGTMWSNGFPTSQTRPDSVYPDYYGYP